MSRGLLLALAALLACARAYEGPVMQPARIAGDENATVIGELGQPLQVRCQAYGYPTPAVFWYRGREKDRVLCNEKIIEVTGNVLLIKSLSIDTLGPYTCLAFNGAGRWASWEVVVRAYGPDELFMENEWLVPRANMVTIRPRPTTNDTGLFTETPEEVTEIVKGKTGSFDTSESSITNEGTTDVIGTSTLDPCSGFQFGCCADNETEASGPDGKGCPCNASEFSRCPDGVSPETPEVTEIEKGTTGAFDTSESSTTNEGTTDVIGTSTLDPCSGFQFGCCADNKTEASGPDGKGCPCNFSEFSRCPDGVSPEMPEEVTEIEKGTTGSFDISESSTTNEGTTDVIGTSTLDPCSGCQFGCCAVNETEAKGPDGQGCPCNSTKKCCPDGVSPETSTAEAITETTTATSKFSETSEGSTTNEDSTTNGGSRTNVGTTAVTGSSTMDLCSSFDFGCCADNETEAFGPDGQGCPCNATEFGCCPDGVSPALGLDNEGCPGPCSTTPHGCCQDEKTPAHGPEFEGCCLLQAFGCCPDNRKPAEGPHLEGCGCQYALQGCCPDNVTIAQGPDNLGCGCQYTQHGCCPDRHTAAFGPNNEGCACNTYQFGCCDDGITIATGPDKQGCHCRDSKFGCCGDGKTHATGPDATGCDCSSSQHGCCPDGRTESTGPKFLGCTDAPENKQAACSLSTDPGPCHNFTAMWYYDLAYGGCSRFWYGGCDGNGNRFATKEECEDVCVQPSPKDACKLPSVKGACDADHQRWHYNTTFEQCIPFRYGGCLGNANNFDTRELCQKQCNPSSVADQCNLPIEQGSCAGNYRRWGFNSEAHRCEQFIWGGCEGNFNRFSSEAACQMRCVGTQPLRCTQPQEEGNCAEKEALWAFSQLENRCMPFYYSGCGGNDNRFGSREACEQTCPSAYVADKCTLPAETGQCSNYRERWFFDTTYKTCRQFYYGGCGGNENNFATEVECDNSCSEIKTTTTTTTTTTRPTEPQTQPPQRPEQEPRQTQEFCFNAIDAGPCTNIETRYAYDSELGRCVTFQYGGCGGNQNNFPDEAYCTFYCQPIQDICQLPMLQGPCEDSQMRWFYDPTSDSCSQFTYGGCEGNDNRFESLEACESRCRTGPAPVAPTTPSTTAVVSGPPECRVSESLEECRYGGVVWYIEPNEHACVSHSNQETGASCRYSGTFPSEEACERACGAFLGVEVCKLHMDPGPCQSYVTKVYFDSSTGQCQEFIYGGCLGSGNRFSSIEECSQVCIAELANTCSLPPEQGNCFLYVQQWYYDRSRDQCNQFVYTGCSGNENRFETQRDCEARCKRPGLTTTTVATIPQEPTESECKTPSSLSPCGNNVTVFYYDSERRECLVSGFGGCRHRNTYSTEEECERRCGAFRGIDVCSTHLDPGPCLASIPKIYWDAMSGSCRPYVYGGCVGGPNRFSSVEECMEVCGDTGPDKKPLPDCTPYQQECEMLDCQYGVDRFAQDGCQRCICREDPCIRVNCQLTERCEVVARRNPASQESEYSAICVFDKKPLPDCTPYQQECEMLDCQYGVDRFAQDGCQRCICREDPCIRVNCQLNERCEVVARRNPASQKSEYSAICVFDKKPLPDCTPYQQECEMLDCQYGVDRFAQDGCQRCICREDPCIRVNCQLNERCEVVARRNPASQESEYSAICVFDVPEAPQALPPLEPEVKASEGGKATLRCLFHGNPPPKITWRFGEITIDGDRHHYRLKLSGALEIISLYHNDTGVYICVADNGLGVATQEIRLVVNDPIEVLPRDCTPYEQECQTLDCQYGIDTFAQDGCQRCICREDPCIRANCQLNERCEAVARRNPVSQEPEYSAKCVLDNEVYPCDEYVANCSRLRCEYGTQRARLPNGCERCWCVQVDIDCEPLKQECNQLNCNYGIERVTDTDGCER